MTETLSQRTVKNSIYSFIGFIWPLVLSFVFIPMIINGLGSARFGFYTLLNTVLMLFGVLDFGVSYTLTQKLSANRQSPEGEDLSKIFNTTFGIYFFIGLTVLFCLLFLPEVFKNLFNIPSGFISSFNLAFFILGVIFFFNMITIPFNQIPYALQRSDIGIKISLVSNTIIKIGSVIAIKTGHGILSLLIIQLFGVVFVFLSLFFIRSWIAPNLKIRFEFPKKIFTLIWKQGFWVFLSNSMSNVLGQFDKFVLGAVWGPSVVGYYSTAQMIPEKISGTSFSISHIFFPIFSEISNSSEKIKNNLKNIFRRSMGLMPVITGGLVVLVFVYGYELLYFWVNKDFADNAQMSIKILAITYFLLGFGSFFNSFLSGLKALKFLVLFGAVIAITDVIFMFLLIPKYGLNGASIAYFISSLPILGFLYYIERKYLESNRQEIISFYIKLFIKIFIVGILSGVVGFFIFKLYIYNLWATVAVGALNYIIYLVLFWIFGFFQKEDVDLFKNYFKQFLLKFK